jgi:glycine cleavage system H protein
MKVLNELLYSNEHEWVKVEGKLARLGITDHAQNELGDVVYLELPEVGDEFQADDAIGVVESVKAASDLYTPVSGKVVEVNEELPDKPEAINEDPYGSWMVVIEMDDESQVKNLMSPDEYIEFCDQEG